MPQSILPLFSNDMIIVNNRFAVQQMGDTVFWFQGSLPVLCHHVDNQNLFRLFCSQLINMENATAAELSRALGVNREKLSRWARIDRSSKVLEPSASAVKKKRMS